MAASPLDELLAMPGAPGEGLRDRLENPPNPGETPDQQVTRTDTENRMKASDLKSRGIPSYTDQSGRVKAVTDETGQVLTGADSKHGIAYDSSGAPKAISYDSETGPPKLSDPFAGLPETTDPKTGDKYKIRDGLPWQYTGNDPVVTAKVQQQAADKELSKESTLLGRKLTLDEHDLIQGNRDHKALRDSLTKQVPTLIDPKYEGADLKTVTNGINKHFDSLYAAPEANAKAGWFGSDLSQEAMALRTDIDNRKAAALASATKLFSLKDQLGGLSDSVRKTRDRERLDTEQLLAHQRGQRGPLDPPDPIQTAQKQADGELPIAGPPPAGPKAIEDVKAGKLAYAVDEDGRLQLNANNPIEAAKTAVLGGHMAPEEFQRQLPQLQALQDQKAKADAATAELAAKVKAAGGHSDLKAILNSIPRSVAILKGVEGGALVGGRGGALVGAAVPGVGETGVSEVIGGIAGSAIGAFAGGYGAAKLYDAALSEAAKYSQLAESVKASSDLHPIYNEVGQIAAFGVQAATGARNIFGAAKLAYDGAEAAKVGSGAVAATKVLAKTAGVGGASMVATNALLTEGAKAVGLGDQHYQVSQIPVDFLLGAGLAGRHITFQDYSPNQLGNILVRAKMRNDMGIPLDAEVKPGVMEEALGNQGIKSTDVRHYTGPLTPQEQAIYKQMGSQIKAMEERGDFEGATGVSFKGARQAIIPPPLFSKISQPISTSDIEPIRGEPGAPRGTTGEPPTLTPPEKTIPPEKVTEIQPKGGDQSGNQTPRGPSSNGPTPEGAGPVDAGQTGVPGGPKGQPKTNGPEAPAGKVEGKQTLLKQVTPEGGSPHPATLPGVEHIVSTGVQTPNDYARGEVTVGSKWNEPHDGIQTKHGIEGLPNKGFLIQRPDGSQYFENNRFHAAKVAREAGQASPDITNLQSADLQQPKKQAATKERSSTQVTFSEKDAAPIRNFTKTIPETDLYKGEQGTDSYGTSGYGRENEPHVTALYGITHDDAAAIAKRVQGHGPVTLELGKISKFSDPKSPYDVLKVDVHSIDLHGLNQTLKKEPFQTDHPDYHPHVTLAYVKKGAGDKYVGDARFEGTKITVPSLTFSDRNRVKTEIPLGKQAGAVQAPPREAGPETPSTQGTPEKRPLPAKNAGVDEKRAAEIEQGIQTEHARVPERIKVGSLPAKLAPPTSFPSQSGGLGLHWGEDGSTPTLIFNPHILAETLGWAKERGIDEGVVLQSLLSEEHTHARDVIISGKDFAPIHDAIWEGLGNDARAALRAVYDADIGTKYLAAEYARMVYQLRAGVPVTESFHSPVEMAALLPYLEGPQSPVLESHLRSMEKLTNEDQADTGVPVHWLDEKYKNPKTNAALHELLAKTQAMIGPDLAGKVNYIQGWYQAGDKTLPRVSVWLKDGNRTNGGVLDVTPTTEELSLPKPKPAAPVSRIPRNPSGVSDSDVAAAETVDAYAGSGDKAQGVYRLKDGTDIPYTYSLVDGRLVVDNPDNERPGPDHPETMEFVAANSGVNFDDRKPFVEDPDFQKGPPIAEYREGRYVIDGGHRRTYIYRKNRAAYEGALDKNVEKFGIDPGLLATMRENGGQPYIVALTDNPVNDDQRVSLVRQLNTVDQQATNPVFDAVSAGRNLSPDTVNEAGALFESDPTATPLALLKSAGAKGLSSGFVKDGAIRGTDKNKYVELNGAFTEEGAKFARFALLGRVIDSPRTLAGIDGTPAETKLLNAIGQIHIIEARGQDMGLFTDMLELEHSRLSQGLKVGDFQTLLENDFLAQRNERAEAFQRWFDKFGSQKSKGSFSELISAALPNEKGQMGLLGENRDIGEYLIAQENGQKLMAKKPSDLTPDEKEWKTLHVKVVGGGKLTPEEHDRMVEIEKQLGQQFIVDPTLTPRKGEMVPEVKPQETPVVKRMVTGGQSDLGMIVQGEEAGGQQTLFAQPPKRPVLPSKADIGEKKGSDIIREHSDAVKEYHNSLDRWSDSLPPRTPLVFQDNDTKSVALVTRDPRGDDWRVTYFHKVDASMVPSSHNNHSSKSGAIEEAANGREFSPTVLFAKKPAGPPLPGFEGKNQISWTKAPDGGVWNGTIKGGVRYSIIEDPQTTGFHVKELNDELKFVSIGRSQPTLDLAKKAAETHLQSRKADDAGKPIRRQSYKLQGPKASAAGLQGELRLSKPRSDLPAGSVRPRPVSLLTTRPGLTQTSPVDYLPARLKEILKPHQAQGANLALHAFDGGAGFLNADGTGAGKTAQEISVAHVQAEKGDRTIIITESDRIIDNAFAKDGEMLGIEMWRYMGDEVQPGRVYTATYHNVRTGLVTPGDFDTVIFDEAHNLRNLAGETAQAKAGAILAGNAKHVMYATATPIDKPEQIAYLRPVIGEHINELFADLGIRRTSREAGGVTKVTYVTNDSVTDEDQEKAMEKIYAELTRAGRMIKRDVPLNNVAVKFSEVKLSDSDYFHADDLYDRIYREMYAISPYNAGGVAGMVVRGFLERAKLEPTIDDVMKAIGEGKQVVVFADRIQEGTEGSYTEGIDGTLNDLVKSLEAKLGKGMVGQVYGGDRVRAAKDISRFQRGDIRVIAATPSSGGTGINLDDIYGDQPRHLIVMTAPMSALTLVQIIGRINRLTTLSKGSATILFVEHPVDTWNLDIGAAKLRTLAAAVSGDLQRVKPIKERTDEIHVNDQALALANADQISEQQARDRLTSPDAGIRAESRKRADDLLKAIEDETRRLRNQDTMSVDELVRYADNPAQFSALSAGHRHLQNALDDYVRNSTLTTTHAEMLRAVFAQSNGDFLKEMVFLSDKQMGALGRGGKDDKGRPMIKLKEGKSLEHNPYVSSDMGKVFLHEYGHAGYFTLLTAGERKLVSRVYAKIGGRSGAGKYFASASPQLSHSNQRYYAKNVYEFFAQGFAEYVAEKRVPDGILRRLYERLLGVLQKFYEKLRRRMDLTELKPLFEKIMDLKAGAKNIDYSYPDRSSLVSNVQPKNMSRGQLERYYRRKAEVYNAIATDPGPQTLHAAKPNADRTPTKAKAIFKEIAAGKTPEQVAKDYAMPVAMVEQLYDAVVRQGQTLHSQGGDRGAIETRKQQSGEGSELSRISPRSDLFADPTQVRKRESQQADGGGGLGQREAASASESSLGRFEKPSVAFDKPKLPIGAGKAQQMLSSAILTGNDAQAAFVEAAHKGGTITGSPEQLKELGDRLDRVMAPSTNPQQYLFATGRLGRRLAPGLNIVENVEKGIQSLVLPSAQSPEHLEAAETLGARLGPMHRRQEVAVHDLRGDWKMFERLGVNAEGKLDSNPGVKFMSDMSQGRPMSKELAPVAAKIEKYFDERVDALEKAGAPLRQVRENYFPGMWTRESRMAFNQAMSEVNLPEDFDVNTSDPALKAKIRKRAEQLLEQGKGSDKDMLAYFTRKPMKGRETFRKQKAFDDIMTGVEFGLKPISTNPIDLVQGKLAELDKSIMANEAFRDWKRQGKLKTIAPTERVPEGWEKVNDKYGTMFAPPKEGEFGLRIVGYRIVPHSVGDIINNYLSSSLYNNRYFGTLYTGWMAFSNALNQTQLGVGSGFHAGFTTAEAQISAGANVIKDVYGVMRGNRKISDLGRTVSSLPTAFVATAMTGDKVLNAWRNPKGVIDPRIAQVVRASELAGAGFKLEKGLKTEQLDKQYSDWFSGHKVRAAMRSPIAFVELMAKPIMELLVPRQKAGVFAHLAWRIIEQNPGKALEDLAPEFRAAWNRVDARLGQVRYDRLFMNNVAKNVVQGLVRAPGWSGGTIAELGGAFKDAGTFFKEWAKTGSLPRDIPDRVAYAISLMLTVGLMNAALTYLFTGKKPEGMDYIAFRTGREDEAGNPERYMLPTYLKDIWAYSKNPSETLLHKVHPALSLFSELMRNKDYYGAEIRNPDASKVAQAGQMSWHVIKAFEPFWIRGAQRAAERGKGLAEKALPLIGVMPAPKAMNQTPALALASEINKASIASAPLTERQSERRLAKSSLSREMRHGNYEGITPALEKGKIKPSDIATLEKRAGLTTLQSAVNNMPLEQVERVYAKANPKEKAELAGIIARKRAGSASHSGHVMFKGF